MFVCVGNKKLVPVNTQAARLIELEGKFKGAHFIGSHIDALNF
jgi:hypothetical protein